MQCLATANAKESAAFPWFQVLTNSRNANNEDITLEEERTVVVVGATQKVRVPLYDDWRKKRRAFLSNSKKIVADREKDLSPTDKLLPRHLSDITSSLQTKLQKSNS